MKIITISSLKGGVGKTTLACFIARALAACGSRVLCVDLDHNNNLTDYWLRTYPENVLTARNILHVLTRSLTIDDATFERHIDESRGCIDVIPATPSLSRIGIELSRDQGAAMRLRGGLKRLDYDYVFIDTPPSLTLELTLGLYAADMVLVPISASRWALQGFRIIADEVAAVAESTGIAPKLLAVPSMVTEAETQAIQAADGWTCSRTAILRDATVKDAASKGRSLREGTKAAEWFKALAGEVAR